MRDYLAAMLLLLGFWWSPAWLLAWVVGRTCNICTMRQRCNEKVHQAQRAPYLKVVK